MDNLKTTKEIVKRILEDEPFCRNSDCFLELEVLKVYAKRQGLDIGSMTVDTLYKHRNEWGFPSRKASGAHASWCRRNIQNLRQATRLTHTGWRRKSGSSPL